MSKGKHWRDALERKVTSNLIVGAAALCGFDLEEWIRYELDQSRSGDTFDDLDVRRFAAQLRKESEYAHSPEQPR